MAYWIQETGQANGANRIDWKLFNCDYASDINKLPTRTTEGVVQEADPTAHVKAKAGDQCLCLENSSVYELRYEPNDWKKL